MTDFLQISTTTATQQQAEKIAHTLVEERLAACVQITGPIRSIYRWQEKIEQTTEWLCIIKTRNSLFDAVQAKISESHAYECPEIIATPILHASKPYQDWLNNQLANPT